MKKTFFTPVSWIQFCLRLVSWFFIHIFYRVDVKGLGQVPKTGAGLIICNHVSFIDAIIIFGSISRPVKFVMHYKIFQIPGVNMLFRLLGAIPIASKKENEQVLNAAYDQIDHYLEQGELVVIFPEGKITHTGKMEEFKGGILKILEKRKVTLIPSALVGLYGSMFSRKDKTITRIIPKSFFSRKISFRIGQPLMFSQTLPDLVFVKQTIENLYHH